MENGVVQVYGGAFPDAVKNLYIIDGSVFVTGGAVNPTSTIQAIALRVADHLKRNAQNL